MPGAQRFAAVPPLLRTVNGESSLRETAGGSPAYRMRNATDPLPMPDRASNVVNDYLSVNICQRQQSVFHQELRSPIEFGRQRQDERRPYYFYPVTKDSVTRTRVVMGAFEETAISRQHFCVDVVGKDRVVVTNESAASLVDFPDQPSLRPGESCEVSLPCRFTVSDRTIAVDVAAEVDEHNTISLTEATVAPGVMRKSALDFGSLPLPALENESILRWLQSVMHVLQSAANTSDFFDAGAQAVVDIAALDIGAVISLEGSEWKTRTLRHVDDFRPSSRWTASYTILERVRRDKRTVWQLPQGEFSAHGGSLLDLQAVLGAPILNTAGEVIAVLYGERHRGTEIGIGPQISKTEAMLIETVACGLAAGLARLDQEQAALGAQVRFEQFFSEKLARQLQAEPNLLEGKDLDVTVLFCDIRGFSRVSERLKPAVTVRWIRDVLGDLSECVVNHDGVLVDYVGDELMAMFGAPLQQGNHAEQACRAAQRMTELLAAIDERWEATVEQSTRIGIGINTGTALVGNIGSHRKFKYGALGNAVNVGSRVQGASKYLKTDVLMTADTRAKLDGTFPVRRLCQVRVVNIATPVNLYELSIRKDLGWNELRESYEDALKEFEQQHLHRAVHILGNLLAEYPNDGPTLMLMSRAVSALIDRAAPFNPVWELPGK